MAKLDIFKSAEFGSVLGLDAKAVRAMIASGELGPDDCVRRVGEKTWIRISKAPDALLEDDPAPPAEEPSPGDATEFEIPQAEKPPNRTAATKASAARPPRPARRDAKTARTDRSKRSAAPPPAGASANRAPDLEDAKPASTPPARRQEVDAPNAASAEAGHMHVTDAESLADDDESALDAGPGIGSMTPDLARAEADAPALPSEPSDDVDQTVPLRESSPVETKPAPEPEGMSDVGVASDAAPPGATDERVAKGSARARRRGDDGKGDELLSEVSFRRRRRKVEELDLTAMVDVTFLLVMFFMLTSTYTVQQTIDVPAPDPDEQGAKQTMVTLEELRDNNIVVTIEADNKVFVDDEEVDPARLEARIRASMRDTGRNELVLYSSGDAYHDTVVKVVDAANEVGMQRIRLAAAPDDSLPEP